MKIENKILLSLVIFSTIFFIVLQFGRGYGENRLSDRAWDRFQKRLKVECVAGCKEVCGYYMGDKIKGMTKSESAEYLQNEMAEYQIREEEVFVEIEKCKKGRKEKGLSEDNAFYPFYPYDKFLKAE